MLHGRKTDYEYPFADVFLESDDQKIDRVVSIGLQPLLEWWERIKNDTHPATYGHSGTEFAGTVAYYAGGGRVSRDALRLHDEKLKQVCKPAFQAAKRLGVKINWV